MTSPRPRKPPSAASTALFSEQAASDASIRRYGRIFDIRNAPGGNRLSRELVYLLTLAIEPGWTLFPSMRDHKLIDATQPRIPDEWRRQYQKRPIEKLPADVTRAFDRVWQVEREKDKLRDDMQQKLRHANLKIWIMGLLISPIVSEGAKKLLHWIFG